MPPKYVALEGADGTGKTVLAWRLVHLHGFNYRHEGPPPDCPDLVSYYKLAMEQTPTPAVFDRFLLGELVYGPILRGKSRITLEEYHAWRGWFRSRGGVVVLMSPPMYAAEYQWAKRPHEELIKDVEVFRRTYEEYAKFDYDYVIYEWAKIPQDIRRILAL